MINWIYDCEIFPNFFSLSAECAETGEKKLFEISSRRDDKQALYCWIQCLRQQTTRMVGFNNVNFDYPLLHGILHGYLSYPCNIWEKCQQIISDGDRPWSHRIKEPAVPQVDLYLINHYDNNAKKTSLKVIEFNLRLPSLQELPIPVGTKLTHEQMDTVLSYNFNDVTATLKFFKENQDAIKLRESINPSWINYPDVKIGRQTFIDALEKKGVRCSNSVQTLHEKLDLNKIIFPWINLSLPDFDRVLKYLRSSVITETKGVFKKLIAKELGLDFYFGTGGLHACCDARRATKLNNETILDIDVTSYYPSIAIEHGVYPAHLSKVFCDTYRELKEKRLSYPKKSPESAALKLALNGIYGDSGNEYSFCYDTAYTMSITVNGQLLLCLLCEFLSSVPNIKFIQANTDGVTVKFPTEYRWVVDQACVHWQNISKMQLEYCEYDWIFIKDVNNYLTSSGKKKGVYDHENLGHHKDWSARVVPIAAERVIREGITAEDAVRNHKDFYDFLLRTKIPKSSELWLGDRKIQNVSRYWISKTGAPLVKKMPPLKNKTEWRKIGIHVGFNCAECNRLSDFDHATINYEWYISEVKKLSEFAR